MTSAGLAWVFVSAVTTALANLLLRRSVLGAGGFSMSLDRLGSQALALGHQPLFVGGLFLYGLAGVFWFRVLSTEPLSTSYPLLVSLTFLLVTLGAVVFFQEILSMQKVAGMTVILAGVFLVARA